MSNARYSDLISGNITKKSKHLEVKGPKIEFGTDQLSGGTDLDISWYCPPVPVPISDKIHTHDFDEFLCFLPSNPNDPHEYQAEVEFSFGENAEKQVITEPSIIYLPKGLPHGQLIFKKIDKPVSYMKICLSPRYSAPHRSFHPDYRKYVANPTINTDIVKQSFYINGKLVGTEEKSVQRITYAGNETAGANLTMHWLTVKEPLVLYHPPHSHPYKQYQLFMGGNPMNVEDFDAEVEIALGEEAETHIINSTAMLHIPEGLIHRQVNFRRVGRPVILVNFSLASDDQTG